MKDSAIIETLERLGAEYPWDEVGIKLERKPNGDVQFMAVINMDYERHTDSAYGFAETLEGAIQELHKNAGIREPEAMRERKIKELQAQLEKLKAAIFGPPPYRPGTRLAPGALSPDIEVQPQPQEQA